jgi:hypothetical protein
MSGFCKYNNKPWGYIKAGNFLMRWAAINVPWKALHNVVG